MLPGVVIFDCDGVLVDSEPIANRILASAISGLGHPISVGETRKAFVGTSMSHVMQTVEAWTGQPLPGDWLERLQNDTFTAFRESLRPVPGVDQIVMQLDALGTPICVASSGTLEKIELTLGLTGLRHYFGESVFSSSMVAKGKPHPDLFLHAAEQMSAEPDECTVIEDSLPGVIGARAAGMQVFAYAGDPETDAQGLAAAGGTVFQSMKELAALLGLR